MTKRLLMRKMNVICLLLLGWVTGNALADDSLLGTINIELRGNVVDYSCYIQAGDDNKTVELGRWATKQLRNAGSVTQSIPFTLKLTGCPPGFASMTFSGSKAGNNPDLLALNGTSSATNVAVELRDESKTRLPLEKASPGVKVDANGNVVLTFFANYIATSDNPGAGSANADATFVINYY